MRELWVAAAGERVRGKSIGICQLCVTSDLALLQLFGVDLLLSFEESGPPRVTLLEFNASPDFAQSGDRLQQELGDMFRDVVEVVVKPFFEIESDATPSNLVLIGEKQSRGQW